MPTLRSVICIAVVCPKSVIEVPNGMTEMESRAMNTAKNGARR
jgi:hypothetical protein